MGRIARLRRTVRRLRGKTPGPAAAAATRAPGRFRLVVGRYFAHLAVNAAQVGYAIAGVPVPMPEPEPRVCVSCGRVGADVGHIHTLARCGLAGTDRRLKLEVSASWDDDGAKAGTCAQCLDRVLQGYGQRAGNGRRPLIIRTSGAF